MLQITNLEITKGSFRLKDFQLEIPSGGYCVLDGPSGCGKTTVLETVCGLVRPTAGRICIGGIDVSGTPANRRGVGWVPQDVVLLPGRSVRQQIVFSLEIRNRPDLWRRVEFLMDHFGLNDLADRLPNQLSGGQQQRVAIARSVAFEPALVCFDEPLNALDAKTAESTIKALQDLQNQEQWTVLHVSHSQAERDTLATCSHSMTPAFS